MARGKAARNEPTEETAGAPASDRRFAGRRITKRTFALRKGSAIVRDDHDRDTPPEAEVTFIATAKVSHVGHEFLANGTVEESTILEVDCDSFVITDVTEHEPDPQLPGIDGDAPDEATGDLPAEFGDGGEGAAGSDLGE